MIYRYFYIEKNEPLSFANVKTDTYDMGPMLWPSAHILKKLAFEADKLGRRFLRYKQERFG